MKQISFNGNKNISGGKIAEYRKKNHFSQSELAAKMQTLNINIDQQMISKIEKNQRQITDYELAGFCKCLNTTASEILNNFDEFLY